jgi:hypothetical protein
MSQMQKLESGLTNLKRNKMRETMFALFGIIAGLIIRFIIEQFKK